MADALARVFGFVMLAEGIGIIANSCDQFLFLLVGAILSLAGLAGSTLPETEFWDKLFNKGKAD